MAKKVKYISFNNQVPEGKKLDVEVDRYLNIIKARNNDPETLEFLDTVMRFEYREFLQAGCRYTDDAIDIIVNQKVLSKKQIDKLLMFGADSRDIATLETYYKTKLRPELNGEDDIDIITNFIMIKTKLSEGESLWAAHHGDVLWGYADWWTMATMYRVHPERELLSKDRVWEHSANEMPYWVGQETGYDNVEYDTEKLNNMSESELIENDRKRSANQKHMFYKIYNIPVTTNQNNELEYGDEIKAEITGVRAIAASVNKVMSNHYDKHNTFAQQIMANPNPTEGDI